MKKVNIGIFVCAIILAIVSCQQNNKETFAGQKSEKNFLSTEKEEPHERQFIHTASMNMAVKNCLQSTNFIEQNAIANKGFILKSEVTKNINKEIESVINTDSVKRLTYYNMAANIVVRVPDTSLQSFLSYTQTLATNVKTRLINASDVSFELKLNQMNIASGTRKSKSTVNISGGLVSENALTQNERIVENLKMKDAVSFSTISIRLEQPEEIDKNVVVNNDANWAQETSLANKAWFSLQKGFYYLMSFLVFLLQIWWVVPLFFLSKFILGKGRKLGWRMKKVM